MKSLVCVEPHKLIYKQVADPAVGDGQTLLKIRRVGVCGTDLHAFEGTQPYFTYPRILGHELAAEVAEPGSKGGVKQGDAVTIIPYLHCGQCIACRNGLTNCCVNMRVCGVHIDGGMSEYFAVPSSIVIPGHGLSLEQLALVEPMAIGAHGVRRAAVKPGEHVLVVGAGPIGLAAMSFAKLAGAELIAMDMNPKRIEFCRNRMSIRHTLLASDSTLAEQLADITGGDMPTVVIDATGNLKAINGAFRWMSHGGRYVLIGLQKGDISFSHPEFHKREGTLMSSRNATRGDFDYVLNSIRTGKVDPAIFITHHVSLEQAAGEFDNWLNPAHGTIKAIIEVL